MARLAMPPRPLAVLLLLTLLTLGVGLALKDSCHDAGWNWWALCYNDITPLYGAHHFDRDTFPYVDHAGDNPAYGDHPSPDDANKRWTGWVEYPVLTGLHMWVAARLGTFWSMATGHRETGETFLYVNAAMLAAFALGTTYLLWRMAPAAHRVAFFAAGTPLVFYAFHNWDLMAVFFTVLCLYWFERGRYVASGAALAMGASAKVFPGLVAPFLFLVLLRRVYEPPGSAAGVPRALARALARAGDAWRLTGGALAGALAVNLPFVLFGSRAMWLYVFEFHLERTPNFETIWFVARHYGERWGLVALADLGDRAWLDRLLLAGFLLVLASLALLVWHREWGPREAAFATLLAFLLLNKVFSVQYALWALPFFALLRLPAWSYAFFAAADAWVYYTVFPMFATFDEGTFDAWFRWVGAAVAARSAAYVVLLALVAARVGVPVSSRPPPMAPTRVNERAESGAMPGPGP